MSIELSSNEKKVLLALKGRDGATAQEIMESAGYKQLVEVMSAASWLQSKGCIRIEERVCKHYSLLRKQAGAKELPERRALRIIKKHHGAISLQELRKSGKLEEGEVSIAIGWLKRKGWVEMRKDDGDTILIITPRGEEALDSPGKDEKLLALLAEGEISEKDADPRAIEMLKGRQDIIKEREEVERRLFLLSGGWDIISGGVEVREEAAELTPRLLAGGGWKAMDFRRYDVSAYAPKTYGGRAHPMRETMEDVRRAFLSMGFTEIHGSFVETCFWNMDVLFIPQDHPARDLQDTFYTDYKKDFGVSEDAVAKIKAVHEDGGETDSRGWNYQWSRDEASKTLLRTHTTVNTIRHLANNPDEPCKVFSIERVFRNEALDSTHLPEFYQIEGIVMEPNASFSMLIGLLREFYKSLGFEDVRVRPAYFPYTEPSMEVEAKFKGRWLELGGSGIFRPEVTEPFGVKHPVLAWGLGLERLAMLRLGLKDLRDLYISDVDLLKETTIV
ncbi:MAG: phenylalanine--tRNA ligase subunit alpha [Candidatus Thermoplasmatota archaeon]|nr:phenylalanine--tRNA ligase subunit alpha [Candidatus Thermoplasmatota archaeon]